MTIHDPEKVWSGPRLLVPIAVEALVVNELDQRATRWAINPNRYSGYDKREAVQPEPFGSHAQQARLGVTLHWGLPDALTHGRVRANEALTFPFIPNRWLVVRLETTAALSMKAWIVESDFLSDDATGANPYPIDGEVKHIGRHLPLADWEETPVSDSHPFLTAQGPGDPSFTAYVAHNENVVSFCDTEVGGFADPAQFTYLVCGWYANAKNHLEADPTSQWVTEALLADKEAAAWEAAFEKWLADQRWSFGDEEAGLTQALGAAAKALADVMPDATTHLPRQILCHGTVHRVTWTGRTGITQSGVPTIEPSARDIQERAGKEWQVQADDTLLNIAERYYGDAAGAVWIAARNREAIDSNGKLKPDAKTVVLPWLKTDLPHVAVGNSSGDALAALLEYLMDESGVVDDTVDIAALLEAAQHGLLEQYDEPGGRVALDQAIHKTWFTAHSGGKRWEPAPPRSNQEAADGLPSQWTPSPDLQTAIAHLNRLQASWETARQAQQQAGQELYDLWWKQARLKHVAAGTEGVTVTEPELDKALNDAIQEAVDRREGATSLQDLLTALKQFLRDEHMPVIDWESLSAEIGRDEDTLKATLSAARQALRGDNLPALIERELPRFYKPTDPVVAIFGGQRSTKHGRDGRFRADNTLFVRVTGQTVGGLTVNGMPVRVNDTLAEKAATLLAAVDDKRLPVRDIRLLLEETMLLDPAISRQLLSETDDADALDRLHQTLWSETAAMMTPEALADTWGLLSPEGDAPDSEDELEEALLPSPHGFVRWSPPWSPLFLSWQVSWYPTSRQPETALASWQFDPLNGLEYDWTGSGLPDHSHVLTISGRSLLTDGDLGRITTELRKSMEAADAPADEVARLRLVEAQFQSADVVLQTMTGFHDRLLQRVRDIGYLPRVDETSLEAPTIPLRALMGKAIYGGAPYPYQDGAADEDGNPTAHFYPIRAGHFRVNKMWLIDSFGQVFDPITERGQTSSSFVPLRGRGLTTVGGRQRGDTQVLQLPPRLLQRARLRFQFQPAGDESDNPVCGWFLPNYQDESLMVYDRAGALLGILLLVSAEAQASTATNGTNAAASQPELTLGWAGTDMSISQTAPDLSQADAALHRIVEALFAGDTAEKRQRFRRFMTAVDRSMWTVDPVMGRQQPQTSLLIGRPIAVARAGLRLETDGAAARNQVWAEMLKPPERRWHHELTFNVQLGDILLREDGLFGFFADTPTEDGTTVFKFHAAYPGEIAVEGTAAPPDLTLLELTLNATTASGAPRLRDVIMLFDPEGKIHARTGILPTTSIMLPAHYLRAAAERMPVTFRMGPMLTEANRVRMPLPAQTHGSWQWLEKSGVNLSAVPEIEPLSPVVMLDEPPPTIREGWLKLTDHALESVATTGESEQEDEDTAVDNNGQ